MLKAVTDRTCNLQYLSAVLYCASHNQDNRPCCEYLNLADASLGVGDRCLRFCNPSDGTIRRIDKEDITCLYNWNVIMFCHHSNLRI